MAQQVQIITFHTRTIDPNNLIFHISVDSTLRWPWERQWRTWRSTTPWWGSLRTSTRPSPSLSITSPGFSRALRMSITVSVSTWQKIYAIHFPSPPQTRSRSSQRSTGTSTSPRYRRRSRWRSDRTSLGRSNSSSFANRDFTSNTWPWISTRRPENCNGCAAVVEGYK